MATTRELEAPNLLSNTVLLSLTLGRPGNWRKVDSHTVEVDADRDSLLVSKELLESKSLRDIGSFDDGVRRWIYVRCIPASVFKAGVYRLPLDLVQEVDDRLTTLKAEREGVIDRFLQEYDDAVWEARNRLRSLFNEKDYPPQEVVRALFRFQWSYLTLGTPESLSSISASLLRREQEKAAVIARQEIDDIKNLLREGFLELVDRAVAQFNQRPDGKLPALRQGLVDRLQEFLTYFSARNVVNDTDLAQLVERGQEVLGNATADNLRDNLFFRSRVGQAFSAIRVEMEEMGIAPPTRKIRLEED